jgi:hypothetical protein
MYNLEMTAQLDFQLFYLDNHVVKTWRRRLTLADGVVDSGTVSKPSKGKLLRPHPVFLALALSNVAKRVLISFQLAEK